MSTDNIITAINDLRNKYDKISTQPLSDWVNTHDYNSGAEVMNQIAATVFARELEVLIDFVRRVDVGDSPTSY